MTKDNLTKENIEGTVNYWSTCPLCEQKTPDHLAGQLKFSNDSWDKVWKYICEQQNIKKIEEQKKAKQLELDLSKEKNNSRFTKLFWRIYIK